MSHTLSCNTEAAKTKRHNPLPAPGKNSRSFFMGTGSPGRNISSSFIGHSFDEYILEKIIASNKRTFDRKTIKSIFGGQKLNKLERVVSLIGKCKKNGILLSDRTLKLAELAVLDDDYMPAFLALMPDKQRKTYSKT